MPSFICQGCGVEQQTWAGSCPSCGNTETIQLKPNEDRMVGRVIKNRFKIIRRLGQGGMGAVYLAEQLGVGMRLALKFLKSEFSTDAEVARRFLNEAKTYAKVAHPNAVGLHDFGQDEEGNLFIAMEYCEGVDLKKVLTERKRMPPADALDLILQVADVLAEAHAKDVVHRDLKPENIMVRSGMRGMHVKVLDFGIARLMGESTQLTMQGAIAGTPRYMSPEQVEGKSVDHRADIYALGILLYECLTGVQPFDGNTIAEILRKQVMQPMPLLKANALDVDHPELDEVIQKACAKKPDDRFADMVSFAAQLAQLMPTQAGRFVGLNNVVGSGSADGGTGATMLRQPTVQQAAPVSIDLGRSLASMTPPESAASNESLLVVPKSRAPLFGLLGVAAVACAGVGFFVLRGSSTGEGVAKVDLPSSAPVVPSPLVVTAVALEVSPSPAVVAIDEATMNRGRDYLARASTAFNAGNLEEAEVYLRDVPDKTSAKLEAQVLDEKIATIRKKTKQAESLIVQGRCDLAVPIFNEVTRMNGRIKEAAHGLVRCKQAALPETLDP